MGTGERQDTQARTGSVRRGGRGARGGDPEAAVEARTLLRVSRARAHDDSDRFVDVYVWVFAGLLLTTWVLSFARETFTGRACGLGADACVLRQESGYVALAVALLGLGSLVLGAGAAGPVSADRAVVRWLLGTTADRAVLLRGGLVGAVTASTFGGAVVGMLTAVAATSGRTEGAAQGWVAAVSWGAALGAAVGGLVPLLLLRPQAGDQAALRAPGRGAGRTLTAVGLLLLGWLAVDAPLPGGLGAGDPGLAVQFLWVPLVLLLVLWVPLLLRAAALTEDLSDVQLARGREVVDAVVGSTLMLDDSLLAGLKRRRQDRDRGRHRSAPLRLRGVGGFLVADLRMVRRRWRSVGVVLLVVPAVLVAGEGLGYGAGILLTALLAASAGKQAGQGLRTWVASAGLRRLTTVRAAWVTGALCVAPVAASALVAVPAVLALGGPWWGGVHLAVAGLAATLRAAEPVSLELGAVVSTPAGALPTGLLQGAARGPDLAVVLALVLLLRDQPWVLLAAVGALGWQVAKDR